MALLLILALVAAAPGQSTPATKSAAADVKPFKPEELEALVAPVALYPDSLLAQVLMASTYPLEVVMAQRWAETNKTLKGDALATALNKETWDPSVKSLVDFPQVLDMMSKQLDWTTKLGDAFIADQKAVMAAAQKLRAKAKAEGNLKSSQEIKVTVEQAPPPTVVVQGAPPAPEVIVIESASPSVVYVPTYNPAVVYGTWPYPYYPPPAPYYPPGYVASNLLSFGAGVAVGAAWGHAWGHCDWGGGDIDIDVDRNTNLNRNINRESHRQNINNRSGNRTGTGGRSSFQHDPSHRGGVSYRDQGTANRMSQPGSRDAAKAREDFRGRADAGRQDIGRGGADSFRGSSGASGSVANRAGGSAGSSARPDAGRTGSSTARPSQTPSSPNRGSAFQGADRGGSQARASSSRGQTSRASPSPSRSAPSRSSSGGSRGGGGGSRGGGGGRR